MLIWGIELLEKNSMKFYALLSVAIKYTDCTSTEE